MAETVLSMARSMLGSAVSKAAAAAAQEMSLLMGVQNEIWFMKDELETMQAFLVAPEVTKKKDKLVKVWAKQVRDLSYDIEDCLDEFTVHVGSQSLSQQMMKLKDRHRIAVQIRNLKARVEEVSKRNTRYHLIKTEASNTTMDETESYLEDIRNHSASNIDEAQLVGFDEPKKKLLEMIQEVRADDGHARVISVVGMGGLGKTTLARKIYESKEDIAKNFTCRAWITVSQSFLKIDLLKDMIKQLLGDKSLERCLKQLEGKGLHVNDLASYLTQGLKDKMYFVILDDLWTIEAWNWINKFASLSNKSKGSRIIVTTRDAAIAKACSSNDSLVYHLQPLEIGDAKELLLRKAQKDTKATMSEGLMTTVEQLATKCGCLPLAILTVGGILASKKIEEWEKFNKQLSSEVENNPDLEPVRRIVTLSYNHLPSHLKPCFLYLSIFPEDFEIKRRRLVDRWIAEGLVTARGRVTVEEVGESYFQQLISRSMILPARVNFEGVVKSCRVHDIVRDTIISISREENFVYLTEDNVAGVVVGEKFRHVAYHDKSCTNVGVDWSCVRSLTSFGERPMKPAPSLCSPELRMLRTLDLKDAQFKIAQKDIDNIGLLRHLKYVNAQYDGPRFSHSNIYALPRSIGKLQSLQFLDLSGSCISALPTEVTKLQSLRSLRCTKHIEFCDFDPRRPLRCMENVLRLAPIMFTPLVDSEVRNEMIAEAHLVFSMPFSYLEVPGVRVPRGIGNLKVLQILEVVDLKGTSTKAIEELGELSQLRKLSVTTRGAAKGKCTAFCKALVKLVSLRSVHVDSSHNIVGGGTLQWLGSPLSPPPLLRSLKLIGKLQVTPAWFGSLTLLVKIYLRESYLKDLQILGALPQLMLLQLIGNAYTGEKLTFRTGAFPSLRKLVSQGYKFTEMRFEEDASPHMESIDIGKSWLKSGIIGIKHLPSLKEISLGYNGKVAGLNMLQAEVNQHPNKPVLRLLRDQSYHDLGDVIRSGVEVEATEPQPDDAEESSQVITTADNSEIQTVPS
ncbi:putative disease resistance RPP13-like protein 3 [Miscanthus floridulus]|uniref:putative disease resistance RPP13-like protein 3 n=1 Tax=Miscanthus floridulus TaxID=154761 RepID=UPI0034588549